MIAVLCGALASPELRVWWWIGAIVLDMLASYIGSRKDGWNLNPGHFVERHGLIIIIALGESLIVSASAISAADMSIELMTVGGLAVVVTCLLWWSYFSWIFEKLEHKLSLKTGSKQSSNARDAFSLMHYILICGIIGISVSFEHILQHPEELLTLPIAYTLCGGYILFTGFTAFALWRTTNVFLLSRFILIVLTSIAFIFIVGKPTFWALGIVSISLLLTIFFERKRLSE